jgi:integrase/recombinase XerD
MSTDLAMTTKQEPLAPTELPLDLNPAAVYLGTLASVNSRASLHWCLDLAAEVLSGGSFDGLTLNWSAMRYQHLAALRAKLLQPNPRPIRKKPYSISTVNMVLTAVKGTVRQAWRLGLIEDSVYLKIMDEKGVRGDSQRPGRALTECEKRALLEACENDPTITGIRDSAIICLMIGCGLRRGEVVALDLEDYQRENSIIVIRRGKGRRYREVPVSQPVCEALDDYLSLRGYEEGPLLYAIRWKDRFDRRRLNGDTIWGIICKRYNEAGIDPILPHDCRRTFITDVLSAGADLGIASKLVGHRSLETTSLYDRRDLSTLREAVETVNVPYLPRRERGNKNSQV